MGFRDGFRGGFRPGLTGSWYSNGVPLSGVNGSYISTADKNQLDITGDLEIVVRVALDDWTPTTNPWLVNKRGDTAGGGGYGWGYLTTANPYLRWSTGAAARVENANDTVPFADGAAGWMKVTLDVDNGSSGTDVKFYTATDSSNVEPTVWTQLGTTRTTATAAAPAANTDPLALGARFDGAGSLSITGRYYRAIIRNGIGGTVVADFNSELSAVGGYTDAYGNVWVIN